MEEHGSGFTDFDKEEHSRSVALANGTSHTQRGGNPAANGEKHMTLAEMCAVLVAMFAFTALVLKALEMARSK